ncbi:MAG: hypothetical protein ABIS06_20475 [Vicinamibacterales bacterium]
MIPFRALVSSSGFDDSVSRPPVIPPSSHPRETPAATAMTLSVVEKRFAGVDCKGGHASRRQRARDCSVIQRSGNARDRVASVAR